jgi:hypothetical protein
MRRIQPAMASSKRKPRLLKADVIAAFDGVERHVALALGCSAQAINSWGRFVPEARVYELLYIKPELKAVARYVKATPAVSKNGAK